MQGFFGKKQKHCVVSHYLLLEVFTGFLGIQSYSAAPN